MLTSERIENLVLLPIICGVVFYSIFFGIEMMDSGFIISLSERLSHGAVIYRDFDYVRPPLSIIMWHIFLSPFYSSPYLFIAARCIVLLQFAVVAWNLVSSQDTSGKIRIRLWALYFGLSININPVMPWHTIDGLFFLSFALRWLHGHKYALAITAAILAALCKQSFIFPALFLSFYLVFHYRKLYKTPISHLIPFLLMALIAWYFNLIDAAQYYRSSEKSGFNEFFEAGIMHYYNIISSKVYIIIFLLSLVITIAIFKNNRIGWLYKNFAIMILLYMFIAPVGKIISNQLLNTSYGVQFNLSFADVLLPVTLFYMLISGSYSFKNLFVLVIVWSSSLSWGYNNILFALPFVLLLFQSQSLYKPVCMIPFLVTIATARLFFTYGETEFITNRLHRITNTPAISGIYTDVNKIKYIKEAKFIAHKYKYFIFVDCNNFAPVMYSEYPNRAVWEYDTESPNFRKDLELIKNREMYFILDRARIGKGSFHKSTFAAEVIRLKKKVHTTSHFLIYH